MVSLVTIVLMCSFDCLPSFGFRSTRYGANAAGQTTSIIATSIEDECVENALASCAYDWSDAAGCGSTVTLIPVSLLNRVASAVSRLFPSPTESPTKVMLWPPYFALIAFAFLTCGGLIVAAARCTCARPLVAAAVLREAMRARAPTPPAGTSSLLCFTPPNSFLVDPPHLCGPGTLPRFLWGRE